MVEISGTKEDQSSTAPPQVRQIPYEEMKQFSESTDTSNPNTIIINNYSNKPTEGTRKMSTNDDEDDSVADSSSQNPMCRICHCEESSSEYLISPCYCSGTLRYVHQSCLQQWLKSNGIKSCELCKYDFIMSYETRPFKNWEKLDMNNIERRKILCSVTFHIIAITCVVWSLYVLIDRTAEEGRLNKLDWSFWTKLVVVAIGFTGGVIFMYIQCKLYIQLCIRWRQYNRVIIIQPITDEILKNSKKKILGNKFLGKKIVVTNSNSDKSFKLNSDILNDESTTLIMNHLNSSSINQAGLSPNQNESV